MPDDQFLRGWVAILALSVITATIAPRAGAATKYKVLHAFGRTGDGGGLFGGLARDAQGSLYGMTSGGGAYGLGSVFELTPGLGGQWAETILHSFCQPHNCGDGSAGLSGVIIDSKDSLFGLSTAGTFEMTPGSGGWTFKVIYGAGGDAMPLTNDPGQCDLLLDGPGNLYSPCFSFGKNYKGAVSELLPGSDGWKEKNLYDFCTHPRGGVCLGGNYPAFRLAWDTAGNLYGVTTEGGAHKAGVAYELEHTAGTWKEHVLHSFPAFDGDGYNFYAGLAVDSSGNVYGTTLQGGKNQGAGTVFELSPQQNGTWKETILTDFPNSRQNGAGPAAAVVLDKTGNLYGTTTAGGDPGCGCGVVFKMTRKSGGNWKYSVLHRFIGQDEWSPQASVVLDDKGNIYGTTAEGGANGAGVVFEITP